MTQKPKIAGTAPIPVDVEKDKKYFWCTCGLSANQPFCDGSHKNTEFTPQVWVAPESKKVFFCACKRSENTPLCDGSHNKLT